MYRLTNHKWELYSNASVISVSFIFNPIWSAYLIPVMFHITQLRFAFLWLRVSVFSTCKAIICIARNPVLTIKWCIVNVNILLKSFAFWFIELCSSGNMFHVYQFVTQGNGGSLIAIQKVTFLYHKIVFATFTWVFWKLMKSCQ